MSITSNLTITARMISTKRTDTNLSSPNRLRNIDNIRSTNIQGHTRSNSILRKNINTAINDSKRAKIKTMRISNIIDVNTERRGLIRHAAHSRQHRNISRQSMTLKKRTNNGTRRINLKSTTLSRIIEIKNLSLRKIKNTTGINLRRSSLIILNGRTLRNLRSRITRIDTNDTTVFDRLRR